MSTHATLRAFLLAAGLLGASSCGDREANTTAPGETTPSTTESPCAEGFAVDSDGACMDTAAPASCPGGTRPRASASACEPVGWKSTCPPGTRRDASGFGCAAPAPTAPCTGATREAYGEASCMPVGSCSAAFPPAGALVVDATLTDGQLDATHFRVVADAIAAAGDGATIAIDGGVYDEALTVERPLTLVGRCAASVELRSPASSSKPGIGVRARGVSLRGLTLTGHVDGVAVTSGGEATLEDLVVRDARYAGIYVEGGLVVVKGTKIENTHPKSDGLGGFDLAVVSGGKATVEDSALIGGVEGVMARGTEVGMTRVVIARQAPDAAARARPAGIAAVVGARVSMTRGVIADITGDGAVSVESDATVELNETIVRGLRIDGAAARGYGLVATEGGHLVARSTMVSAIEGLAVLARDEGSSLQMIDSTVLGPESTAVTAPPVGPVVNDGRGAGISVRGVATGTLDGVAVIGAWGYGVDVEAGGKLELLRSFIDAPRGLLGAEPALAGAFGLGVNDGAVTLSDVSITRCSGAGVNVGKRARLAGARLLVRDVIESDVASSGSGIAVGDAGNVDLDASVIDAATSTGVLVTQGAGSFVRLARSSVHGTRKARDAFGHGVTVRLGALAVLAGTSIVDNPGIGVAADGGRALLDRSTVARNSVGIHAQGGSFLVEREDPDPVSLTDGEVRVVPTTRFSGNATRVGSGVVTLPAPILP